MKRLIFSLVLVVGFASTLHSAPAKLLRHPDYHQGKVVFSYLGDLWLVAEGGGPAVRLTVHTARDIYPRFSPDGRWIAFSSNRYGNYDVFVMPAEGGPATRLTFNSAADTVVGWSRDSERIIFTSARGAYFPGIPNLYEVPRTGALPTRLPTDWGYWGSYSPDGKRFAFNRHPMVWWRKHYRGSFAADVWVMDVARKSFQKLIADEFEGNHLWPMWGNGFIYFVSDRDPAGRALKAGDAGVMASANNIWKVSEGGGKPVRVTNHRQGNVFWPSISSDGRVIVYENNFGLWKLDTESGQSTEIKADIRSDEKENTVETVTYNAQADSYYLSPSTKRAVISIRGELFTIPTDRGNVTRVTESYARDTSPQWSPDGNWLAFISDRSGRDELWLCEPRGEKLKQVSDSDTQKLELRWAPNSQALLYTATDHKLYRYNLTDGTTQILATSEVANISDPEWSPDSQWVSYTKADGEFRAHVYILPASGGEEHPIADDDLFSQSSARWTPDGKKLVFLVSSGPYTYAGVQAQQTQLYSLSLQKEEKNLFDKGIDDEAAAAAQERPARRRPAAPGEEPPAEAERKVEVKIDFEGLTRRPRQLTRLAENVLSVAVAPDSKSYAFVTTGLVDSRRVFSIYTIAEDGEQLTRLTQSAPPREGEGPPAGIPFAIGISSLQYSKDGRTLFFKEGDGIYSIPVSAPTPAAAPARPAERRRVNFVARVEVDHRAERAQVFNESWRVMKHRFYDPKMHGVDWNRMKSVYEPLLENVADQEEMHNVISQMIGELNASHTGISAFQPSEIQTRYPGFELEPDPSGYYKVAYIYRKGPADQDYVKLSVGNFILAIDGHALRTGENYFRYLAAPPGRKLEFTVNDKPSLEGAWTTRIEPVSASAYATLQYQKWVQECEEMVEKLSGGTIGYLHIRQMNEPALRQFERDLARLHNKKALIIDQRFNPGGGIDQELLAILGQRQYQYTRLRDSIVVTRPAQGFFGPMVVLQNERSTSDAEVFPQGFKELKLGTVVGVPTYGAVIGTGSYRLMDGSTIRTPAVGLWTVTDINLENYGVKPDVYMDNTPADFLAGRDAQLEKAVEILQAQLKKK